MSDQASHRTAAQAHARSAHVKMLAQARWCAGTAYAVYHIFTIYSWARRLSTHFQGISRGPRWIGPRFSSISHGPHEFWWTGGTIEWSSFLPILIQRLRAFPGWFRPDPDHFLNDFGTCDADPMVDFLSSILQRIRVRFWCGLNLDSPGDELYLKRGLGRRFSSLRAVKK